MSVKKAKQDKPVGVIDLGSNSLRLAAFAAHNRVLPPLYNEKEICEIGRGLETTGKLNPDGVRLALQTLQRFKQLADSMGLEKVKLLATAAVREATDGRAFLEEIKLLTGLTPLIVSGVEEARLAAAGVQFGDPAAAGVLGDLGGGSLELATVGIAAKQDSVSLPLGPLRLHDAANGNLATAEKLINEHFKKVDWLSAMHRRNFYAVGGIWRAIAKAHIVAESHPLHVVQQYSIEARALANYAQHLAQLSPAALARTAGISKKRLESVPMAALLLARLVAFGQPSNVIFSAFGLREGYLFDQLSAAEQAKDPLLVYAASTPRRFAENSVANHVFDWLKKSLPQFSATDLRLAEAACLMADREWAVHPEYRAQQAYQHGLAMPIGGIAHADRAFLALAAYVRHEGQVLQIDVPEALALLSAEAVQRATILGLLLRLAFALTGGVGSVLDGVKLKLTASDLTLNFKSKRASLASEQVRRRLANAAKALGVSAVVS